MAGNARRFALEIDKELDVAKDQIGTVVRKLAQDALRGVVFKTPVDTGRAAGNWFVTIGAATTAADPNYAAPKEVAQRQSIDRGTAVINAFDPFEDQPRIILQNNLPYIVRLEDGYSTKGSAMVALTLAELKAQLA